MEPLCGSNVSKATDLLLVCSSTTLMQCHYTVVTANNTQLHSQDLASASCMVAERHARHMRTNSVDAGNSNHCLVEVVSTYAGEQGHTLCKLFVNMLATKIMVIIWVCAGNQDQRCLATHPSSVISLRLSTVSTPSPVEPSSSCGEVNILKLAQLAPAASVVWQAALACT